MMRIFKIILWSIGIGWGLIISMYLCRIFICDQFVIPTYSMTPTLIPGDYVLVNKILFGARIYEDLKFGKDIPMKSWRMPKLRPIHPNDIVIFNAPHGYDRGKIEFKLNYVYCKRCWGTPGDSISIQHSLYKNSNFLHPIGDTVQQNTLELLPDTSIPNEVMRVFPYNDKLFGWTIKNMGKLYIPRMNDKILLDKYNYALYKPIIEYETRQSLSMKDGVVLLGDIPIASYTFKENYYYFCGDNAPDSKDSRYLGFVPESFIIGIVTRISYSEDQQSGEIRWDRVWKNIKPL